MYMQYLAEKGIHSYTYFHPVQFSTKVVILELYKDMWEKRHLVAIFLLFQVYFSLGTFRMRDS